jgi:hypothetical protein
LSGSSLEGFLGFSDADLAANRAGVLSSGQAWRLRWSGVWRLVVGPALLIGCLVLAWYSSSAFITFGALAAASLGLYLTWHGFAFLADATQGLVAFVTAPLHRRSVTSKGVTSYFADVGPVTKKISSNAYSSLGTGPFHLYYAPGCRSLLSVESASEDEPKPPHQFGPDSAHVWDRMRWSWVLIALGSAGLLIGAHAMAVAHPAHPISVEGTVSDYHEHHGKGGTTRHIYLRNDPNTYDPKSEDSYDPPVPPFSTLIGKEVVLYVNAGTTDVLAINDYEQLHAYDWYLHPEHETVNETVNGAASAVASLLAVVAGIALIAGWRRRPAPALDPALARTPLYAMPTIRPVRASWLATTLLVVVAAAVVVVFEVALRSY